MPPHIQESGERRPAAGVPGTALAEEREYAMACREAARHEVADAGGRVTEGEDVSGDGASAEALGRYLRTRARRLAEEPDGPPFFGRLDFEDGPAAGDHRGQRYHVGRRRVAVHPAAPPLVIDWRAPVARVYYQASARDPQGVAVRRRFGWAPGSDGAPDDLTALEDEHLGPARAAGPAAASAAASGLLAAEIERPRLGPMRDIAATIQPEQDDLVRGGLADSVCVQGAPGSGKTAVGLHRAAYLLYTFPERLRRGGLLVIGPNRTFLRYISEVLPALGESGVTQLTVADLVARHPVRAADDAHTAVLKHDERMAAVLERALHARLSAPREPLVVTDGSYRWRVPEEALADAVADVRGRGLPYATGREHLRARAVALVRRQAERRAGPRGAAWERKVGRCRPVASFLDTVWPVTCPEDVVAALLGDAGTLAAAADGLFTAAEQAALRRDRPPRSYRGARWSAADLLLLDEVAGLIEHPEGYGHVVVDEAQDLSPMQCRAVARRSRFGSLTVLGDLAQATEPWAPRDWAAQLDRLGKPHAAVVPLTTGFRVPAPVMELAGRLVPALGVNVPRARSLRPDGELTIRHVDDPVAAVAPAVRAALRRDGAIAVITADVDLPRTEEALRAAGITPATAEDEDTGTAARVTVLPATLVKGLEYDHVIVIEPAAIAEAEPRGLHRLYVVLTRAVSRLDILHGRPLPGPLAG
ncbi:HelD family protein [Streptomyces sp. NPDC021100]|uniref:HelD family protein n=1 Tax=Streptomyces sp. NPDC021100 TaxID=3365114 RepID=UPI00379FC992